MEKKKSHHLFLRIFNYKNHVSLKHPMTITKGSDRFREYRTKWRKRRAEDEEMMTDAW